MRRLAPALIAAVAVAALLAVWWWMRPPELHGTLLQSEESARDFTLQATDGQSHSLSDLRGKWVMLYFGYTFCPDVCPTTMADLRQMKQELGSQGENIQVVMVTLDPERDTIERLASYVAAFDPGFIGMTGDEQAIADAATQFGVFHDQRTVEGASDYLIDHTSIVSVLDPEGHLRYVFPYGIGGPEMAADMRWLTR